MASPLRVRARGTRRSRRTRRGAFALALLSAGVIPGAAAAAPTAAADAVARVVVPPATSATTAAISRPVAQVGPVVSATGGVSTIDRAATATATATAVAGTAEQLGPVPAAPAIDASALGGCDVDVLQRLVASSRGTGQWIVVLAPNTTATSGTLFIATLRQGRWTCTLASTAAQLGRSGITPLVDRRSGDGTTPSGIFPLGVVNSPQGPISFFGNQPDPGASGPYRRVQPGDCYGANPNTPGYGHWRVDATGCTGDDELLSTFVQAYEHAVLIGANTEPAVSGDAVGETPYAAAIFLHRTTYVGGGTSGQPKPTSGCVSIPRAALVTALRTIDPSLAPRFAIGTRATLLATPAQSGLPVR